MKEIEIDCPCCDAKLTIDVRSQTVLKHAQPEQLNEFGRPQRDGKRWDAALDRVQKRGGDEDAFDSALRKEQSRSDDLDALFDRAKGKVDQRREELDDA